MEVLSRDGCAFLQDEEYELSTAAFSWTTAVEQREVFSVKRAFSRFKVKPMTTQALVDTALEKHHFLSHCFSRFRQAISRRRVSRFRRRKLLYNNFQCWLEYNRTKAGEPVKNGALVSACFKWISLTLQYGSVSGNSGAGPEYASQGRLIAATYPPLKPYLGVCMSLSLPPPKVPLLLHAAAMLDAHLLQKHFHLWRCTVLTTKRHVEQVQRRHLSWLVLSTFRSWTTATIMNRFLYHKCRRQKRQLLLQWRLQCYALEQSSTLFDYCFDISVEYSKKRVMRSLKINIRESVWAKRAADRAVEMKRRRDLLLGLRRWSATTKYNHHLRSASCSVSQQVLNSTSALAFGVWLLHAVNRIDMKRSSNAVVSKRFSRLSRVSFAAWKRLSDEARRTRAAQDFAMKERALLLHTKIVALKTTRMITVMSAAWGAWREKLRWRTFCRPLSVLRKKLMIFAAFKKWNLINDLSQIANCVQKLWRGYVVRHLTHRNRTRYMRWIMGGKMRTVMHFHHVSRVAKVFRHWKQYICSNQHLKELYSLRVVQLRSLRVMHRSVRGMRRMRIAGVRASSVRQIQRSAKFFANLKQSVTLRKHLWKSVEYFKSKKLKHALTLLCLRRLWGRCGRESTGQRLLMNSHLRKNISNLKSCVRFVKLRLFSRWRYRVRSCKVNESKVVVVARQNTLWKALSRWRGFCDRALEQTERFNYESPEDFGENYHAAELKRRFFKTLRHRVRESRSRNLRRERAQRISLLHFRAKVLKRFCSHFRDSVTERRSQIRKVQRRYLQPMFKLWHKEFRRNHYYSKRIFTMQVKIMRRVTKNVFLAWRLYSMKARRLEQLASSIISQRMRALKVHMLDRWLSAAIGQALLEKTARVVTRLDHWIKVRAFRKFRQVFELFQELNWKSARVTFLCWAKLVKDGKVTCRAVRRAERYHAVRQATGSLRDWRYITAVHRNLGLWEVAGRRRMIFWKAKVMLQYWRKKSWWLGRRVLWSRTRVLHRASDNGFQSSVHAPFRMSNFSSSVSYFGGLSSMRQSSVGPHRGRPVGAPSAAVGLRPASFKTPLAHEALQMRALRRWRKHIKCYAASTKAMFFFHWKQRTLTQAAKRSAFVNRLQLLDRQMVLQEAFGCFKFILSKNSVVRQCRVKSQQSQKQHFFTVWHTCYNNRKAEARKVVIMKEMLKRLTHKTGGYKVRLAFKTWRLVCRASPNLSKASKMFLRKVWTSWRLNYRATHFFRRACLQKFLLAWSGRVDKLIRTRGCLTQMRHVIMMVETRWVHNHIPACHFLEPSNYILNLIILMLMTGLLK